MLSEPPRNPDRAAASEIVRRIRDEAARQRVAAWKADPAPSLLESRLSVPLDGLLPALELSPTFTPPPGPYHVRDLLRLHYVAFIDASYRAILGRPPDREGLRERVSQLASGASKIAVLGAIRYSAEGRERGVKIRGLASRYAVQLAFRIPIIGYVVQVAISILRLPAMGKHHRALECYAASQVDALKNYVESGSRILRGNIDALSNSQRGLEQSFATLRQTWVESSSELATLIEELDSGQETLQRNIAAAASEQVRTNSDLSERLTHTSQSLETDLGKVATALARLEREFKLVAVAADADAHALDKFYVAFEDEFRGPRSEIKRRLAVYLPLLEEAGLGAVDKPIVDIGCGRGEWLETLKERGWHGRGVDLNRVSLAYCREIGLEVIEADALAYLRSLPDASVGVVTGFHIIEHLPFQMLIDLVDQALRVLKSGGLMLFETPNPGNIMVASSGFYLDPTHRNPLPSATMRFVLESRGLSRVEVIELNPSTPGWSADVIKSDLDRYLEAIICAPQDYAVVGWKE